MTRFTDRSQAGALLAGLLLPLRAEHPIVFALPRGGVPVAAPVAHALGARLEILAVRKIGAASNPELAVGAIAEDDTIVLAPGAAASAGRLADVRAELDQQTACYRGEREPADARGHTAVVVDDGLATGLTALAAVRTLRARGARRIVVAAPVGAPDAVRFLQTEADAVVCHTTPAHLRAIGLWYEDFRPVADKEVLTALDGP